MTCRTAPVITNCTTGLGHFYGDKYTKLMTSDEQVLQLDGCKSITTKNCLKKCRLGYFNGLQTLLALM